MRSRWLVSLAAAVLPCIGAPGVVGAGSKPAAEVLPRVQYHLQQIDTLTEHFDSVLRSPCPHFASADAWNTYFNGEVDRVVSLVAHVEQAWVEAKQTGDDDVRRAAKAPRRRLQEARGLLDKLQQCAGDNGASFSPMGVWGKIEREVPQRQADITQPQAQP